MRNISRKKLKKILKKHELWLKGEGGKCADLSNVDLRGADLTYVNLEGAYLSNVNLSDANLRYANLRYVNLELANLRDTNLSNANLSNANLKFTNLKYTNLSNANLKYANLSYANLKGANLKDVKTNIHTTSYNLACPKKGSFIGYKKANGCIVKLLIPDDAKRSSATTTKCRTNKAKVLDIRDIRTRNKVKEINSDYDNNFIYRVGETVYVDNFNEDRWEECTSGIHFFVNREDAIKY